MGHVYKGRTRGEESFILSHRSQDVNCPEWNVDVLPGTRWSWTEAVTSLDEETAEAKIQLSAKRRQGPGYKEQSGKCCVGRGGEAGTASEGMEGPGENELCRGTTSDVAEGNQLQDVRLQGAWTQENSRGDATWGRGRRRGRMWRGSGASGKREPLGQSR